ncbi:MAG TPA: type II secretion system protein GspG [Cytophagaceae bacterium]|jgi:hypothetical protein|nr:type II secretion system protein GspG [Cytophagaceae bacterium]
MIDANDPLPIDKPEPMKPGDKILLGFLILMLLLTFPFLWWIYRPLLWLLFRVALPIGLIIFLGYFALRALQLGERSSMEGNGFGQNLQKSWTEFVNLLRKYFRKVALTIVAVTILFVGSVLVYTSYSKTSVTEKQLSRTAQALVKYKNHFGNYPQNLSELIGNDPLKREWYQDAWGNQVEYTVSANSFTLTSYGKDGIKGNEDDVVKKSEL